MTIDGQRNGHSDTPTPDPSADSLRSAAKVLEIDIDVKDIQKKWALITYDVPKTEAGDHARAEFLRHSRAIGAVQHTESVYLAPWTDGFSISTLQLAQAPGCKVYVWTAETDPETARELTAHYDMAVVKWLDELDERIDKIDSHVADGHRKLATNMLERTVVMVQELEAVIRKRGSLALWEQLSVIKRGLAAVMARTPL